MRAHDLARLLLTCPNQHVYLSATGETIIGINTTHDPFDEDGYLNENVIVLDSEELPDDLRDVEERRLDLV